MGRVKWTGAVIYLYWTYPLHGKNAASGCVEN